MTGLSNIKEQNLEHLSKVAYEMGATFSGNKKPHHAIKSVGTRLLMQQGKTLLNNPNMLQTLGGIPKQVPQLSGSIQAASGALVAHPVAMLAKASSHLAQNMNNLEQSASKDISI